MPIGYRGGNSEGSRAGMTLPVDPSLSTSSLLSSVPVTSFASPVPQVMTAGGGAGSGGQKPSALSSIMAGLSAFGGPRAGSGVGTNASTPKAAVTSGTALQVPAVSHALTGFNSARIVGSSSSSSSPIQRGLSASRAWARVQFRRPRNKAPVAGVGSALAHQPPPPPPPSVFSQQRLLLRRPSPAALAASTSVQLSASLLAC
jgi:hypothetical protein